jgi:hypothetical protein
MSPSYLSFYEQESAAVQEGPLDVLLSRGQVLQNIAEIKEFDLVVFGGGVTAMLVAHQAALHDLRVVVLSERAIGLDSAQSAAQQIEQAFLAHPWRTIGASRRIAAFLKAFDLTHLWRIPESPTIATFSAASLAVKVFSRLLQRSGSLMSFRAGKVPGFDVGLFAREVGLAARQEGALILSGVQSVFLEPELESGAYRVGFQDRVSGESFEVRVGGVVVDPELSALPRTRLGTTVKSPRAQSTKALSVTEESGIFFCTSGAPWDALWCAHEIVAQVVAAGGAVVEKRGKGDRGSRRLPGSDSGRSLSTFRVRGKDAQLPQERIAEVIRRWQGKVRYLDYMPNGYQPVCAEALRGEIELAIRCDHAATVNEVVEGSLGLDPVQLSAESLASITEACRELGLESAEQQ